MTNSTAQRPQTTAARNSLAIEGGAPLRSAPFPGWPVFSPEEIEATAAVLRSGRVNYWTGNEGRAFEKEYAEYTGTRYAIAVANGTNALEAALMALGIGPGDEVILTSRTFLASASSVVFAGATPVFADVDLDSGTITAASIEAVLTERTKAVMLVHLGGWVSDMDPITELARDRGLFVIEDCAQCHGASYGGRRAGSLGDIAAFSFCQDKIMTTGGEGGMITTDNEKLWRHVWSMKDHGKSWEAVYEREHAPGFRWLHESFGTNWRLTETQAAMGRLQLRDLDKSVAARRRNAAVLTEAFLQEPALRVPEVPAKMEHAYYKYYVYVRPEMLADGWSRDAIMNAVSAEGVLCFSGSCSEIYLEKAFDNTGLRPSERLPNARELGETSLMFLVHPTLSTSDMADVAAAVRKVFARATRSTFITKEVR